MRTRGALTWLVPFIGVLAFLAAGAGLFWRDAGRSFTFTTLHGQVVEIYGQGLYRYDTVFSAAGNKGTDAVTLLVGLPLLVTAFLSYRRGALRGGLCWPAPWLTSSTLARR